MARIAQPSYEIRSIRYTKDGLAPYPKNIYRNYARIDKKFVPIGWFVQWNDGVDTVYFDDEIPTLAQANRNYSQ